MVRELVRGTKVNITYLTRKGTTIFPPGKKRQRKNELVAKPGEHPRVGNERSIVVSQGPCPHLIQHVGRDSWVMDVAGGPAAPE